MLPRTLILILLSVSFTLVAAAPLAEAAGKNKPRTKQTKSQSGKKVTFKERAKPSASRLRPITPSSRPRPQTLPRYVYRPPQQYLRPVQGQRNRTLRQGRTQSQKTMPKPRVVQTPRSTQASASTAPRPITSNEPLRALPAKPRAPQRQSWLSKVFGSVNWYKSAVRKRPVQSGNN